MDEYHQTCPSSIDKIRVPSQLAYSMHSEGKIEVDRFVLTKAKRKIHRKINLMSLCYLKEHCCRKRRKLGLKMCFDNAAAVFVMMLG